MAADNQKQTKAERDLLDRVREQDIETAWDRLVQQLPQCGYGKSGICCKNCNMGPCIVNPFGAEPQCGVCGADAATITARNFLRMVAAGSSAHSDHGRAAAELMIEVAKGEAEDDSSVTLSVGTGGIDALFGGADALFDFSLLPDFDKVRKYFGLSAAYGTSRPDGFFFEIKILEPTP